VIFKTFQAVSISVYSFRSRIQEGDYWRRGW